MYDYDSGDKFSELMGSLYGKVTMCSDCEVEEATRKQNSIARCGDCADAAEYEEQEILDELDEHYINS
jgi:hypothetical protein